MIKPYELFVVGPHSTVMYFDSKMDLFKADGTHVNDELRDSILANPEIIRTVQGGKV